MRARVRDSYGSPGLLRLDLVTGLPYAIRLAGFGLLRPRVHVPGSDVAGTVAAVGQNGTRFRPGDEVFGTCAGSFAEYASAHRTTSRQARERHVRAGCRTHLRVCCPAGPPGHRKGGGGAEGPGHRRRRGRGDIRGATGQGIRSTGRGRVQHGQGQGRRSRAGPASRLHALTPPSSQRTCGVQLVAPWDREDRLLDRPGDARPGSPPPRPCRRERHRGAPPRLTQPGRDQRAVPEPAGDHGEHEPGARRGRAHRRLGRGGRPAASVGWVPVHRGHLVPGPRDGLRNSGQVR